MRNLTIIVTRNEFPANGDSDAYKATIRQVPGLTAFGPSVGVTADLAYDLAVEDYKNASPDRKARLDLLEKYYGM